MTSDATVTSLLSNIAKATEALAEAVSNEMSLEDGRAKIKMEAVQRIMAAGDNPMTSKPHSFSSAEAVANTDKVYNDYLATVRQAAVQRILARGRYDSALIEAQLIAGKR
jgi:hypothetical protein